MSRIQKSLVDRPCPQGTEDEFMVKLTHKEMQCIANAVTGFYNVSNREKWKISVEQVASIESGLSKMNRALKGDIVVVQ